MGINCKYRAPRFLSKAFFRSAGQGGCLALVLIAVWADAASREYRAALADSAWTSSSTPESCELSHVVGQYGTATVAQNNRGRRLLKLEPVQASDVLNDNSTLFLSAPEWKVPLADDPEIKIVVETDGLGGLSMAGPAVTAALEGLSEGNYANVRYSTSRRQVVTVSLSPVFFAPAYAEFVRCVSKLPPPRPTSAEAGFDDLRFKFDDYSLAASTRDTLDRLVEYLNRNTHIIRLRVSGHADDTGKEKHNRMLSQARADGVARYLTAKGIPKSRIVVRSFGESNPKSSNKTRLGRSVNRRVELEFVYGEIGENAPASVPEEAPVMEDRSGSSGEPVVDAEAS